MKAVEALKVANAALAEMKASAELDACTRAIKSLQEAYDTLQRTQTASVTLIKQAEELLLQAKFELDLSDE